MPSGYSQAVGVATGILCLTKMSNAPFREQGTNGAPRSSKPTRNTMPEPDLPAATVSSVSTNSFFSGPYGSGPGGAC